MKLNDLIKGEGESVGEYLARTYWSLGVYPNVDPLVFVYNNPSDLYNLDKKPVKKISHEKAQEYIETLYDEREPTKTQPESKVEEKPIREISKVTEETIEGEILSQWWVDVSTGKVCHRFGLSGGAHNGN